MKSGKRVLGVIIVSLILISSIVMVSAGLKDWFGFGDNNENLQGELPESAVAKVKISNTAVPNITFVSHLAGNGADTVTNSIKLKPRTGGDTLVSFSFLAQQGGDQPGELFDSGSSSRVNLTRNGEISRINVSCLWLGIVACPPGICTGNAVNFSCTVPMKYYDGNGTWSVNVSVKAPTTGWGYNITKTFKVEATFAGAALTTYVNWTNPPLTTATTNRLSDNNISVENNGNVPYSGKLSVSALDLPGITTFNQYIPAERFNANGCLVESTLLVNDTLTLVPAFTAIRAVSDLGMTTNLSFCVTSLSGTPTALSSQDYASTKPWTLQLASS